MKAHVIIISLLGLCWSGAMLYAGPTNSIYLRAERDSRAQSIRGHAFGAGSSPAFMEGGDPALARGPSAYDGNRVSVREASWITVAKPRPRDVRVHDLVTIVVNEVSKSSTKAKTKTERKNSVDAALEDWLKFTNGKLGTDAQGTGDPKVKLSYTRKLDAKGDIDRQDMLTARIRAEVMDVLPNGNLVLEATHTVVTDDEKTTITLTGMCSGKDIGADKTVLSSALARLDIRKEHTGMTRDATKRGLVFGFLDWLAIF